MVPKCPKCATELRDDYGMVRCPGCGSIVFVDLEGNANVASEEPAESAVGGEPNIFEALADVNFDAALPKSEVAQETPVVPDFLPPEVPVFEESPANEEMNMNAFLGYEPEAGAIPVGGRAAAAQTDPDDPLGISAYSNSELSAAKNGPLVVRLIISGIDAKDLRDEIRQALQDSRFGWDTAALMSSIKGGILRIEQVSPVKATIIINRIKNLSVRIRWEQNAITEIDPVSPKP